jgi:hypothetical protein
VNSEPANCLVFSDREARGTGSESGLRQSSGFGVIDADAASGARLSLDVA